MAKIGKEKRMLQLLLWKSTFISVNFFQKLFGNRGPRVFHFAYGANVDPKTLQVRGVKPFSTEIWILDDYQLCFSHPGPFAGQGFADIIYNKGHQTFGYLYEISMWDRIRLHLFELALFFDRHRICWITQHQKKFYFYKGTDFDQTVLPTCAYLKKITTAYQRSSISIEEYERNILNHACLLEMPRQRRTFHFCHPPRFKSKVYYQIKLYYEKLISKMMMKLYPHPIAGLKNKSTE